MNKYKKIADWLDGYVPAYSWIFFNVSPSEPDELTLNSVQNERELQTFIDGAREVEFLFALDLAKEFDIGTSEINLNAIEEFNKISDWVETQNIAKNFPDFGDNIIVESVEVLETVPSVSVDNQNQVAKYQGQFRITYIETRKEIVEDVNND